MRYDAVVFDLLTALLDSWTLWNGVAGSSEAGLVWRRRYLEITYGCGAYRPYEVLVREAARDVGLPESLGEALERRWGELAPWPEATSVLSRLPVPLAVATNCSVRLGRQAADRVGVPFKVVATAESVGFYKPRPEPYRAVLAALGTAPERTLFVAGSASDVPGAKGVGMAVYWHNRIRLPPRDEVRPDYLERTLDGLGDSFPPPQRSGYGAAAIGGARVAEAGQFKPEEHRFGPTHWFEDLTLGQKFYINSRTQTESLFAAFQMASGDNHPIHYDREYCKARGHRDLLAHGLQVAIQGAAGGGIFPHIVGDSLIGFLEQSSRFLKPVYCGDTLYPLLEVSELKPGRTTGVVVLKLTIHNQKGELVCDGEHKYLVKKRPH